MCDILQLTCAFYFDCKADAINCNGTAIICAINVSFALVLWHKDVLGNLSPLFWTVECRAGFLPVEKFVVTWQVFAFHFWNHVLYHSSLQNQYLWEVSQTFGCSWKLHSWILIPFLSIVVGIDWMYVIVFTVIKFRSLQNIKRNGMFLLITCQIKQHWRPFSEKSNRLQYLSTVGIFCGIYFVICSFKCYAHSFSRAVVMK